MLLAARLNYMPTAARFCCALVAATNTAGRIQPLITTAKSGLLAAIE